MDEQQLQQTEKVIPVVLEKEMRQRFLDYSVSVLVSRALPDVRDGLKPVHRRILYTMHENSLTPDKAYRKCADTVGTVLGRYHPHGDASVYDAMVRMAQDFSLRYPLVDGHGNFGSIDGHPAAAYRYTEARMNKMSLDMLADIDKETVDFIPNYDDRLKEPVVLPSRFPNLLVNGSAGIAVGMATNIPPHNLGEVVDAICLLIDNPDAELPEIMEAIKGPDFPTGGIIMGTAGIRAAYATGRGKITLRAKAEIEEHGNGRFRIVVTEIPYKVNKLSMVKSIIDLVDDKRLEGISDVVDHSSKEGMRIVIEVKKDANPQVVLNHLYAYTEMQVTFGAILLALVNGVPRVLTLKQMLEEYIKFQVEVITRRTRYELGKTKERAHIMEALKTASDFIDEVIAIIRAAADVPTAKEKLMARFDFDDVQADAIVKMRLGQLAGLERQKIEDELGSLLLKIAELEALLGDEHKIKDVVKEECRKMQDKYGDERRTEISPVDGEMDDESLIPEEDCVLTMTRLGYIKLVKADTYTVQRTRGVGKRGMGTREGDEPERMFFCSSHDPVMFFTNAGRVYRMKAYKVGRPSELTTRGVNIVNLLPLAPEEKVTAMLRVPEVEEDLFVTMVTRHGVIKRTRLDAFANVRKNGLIAVDLDEGDQLVNVEITDGYQHLLLATRKGMAIRFKESDARVVGRPARGVRAITLQEGDEVVSMMICRPDRLVLTVSETGYGRLSDPGDYRVQSRGGKGLTNYRVGTYGDVAAVRTVELTEDVILIADNGNVVRLAVADIRQCRRPSKGVTLMKMATRNEGARVVALVCLPHEEGETEAVDNSTLEEEAPTEE
ncbi:MAG: DNA gyrase subunit A [Acutalibacteraceae bacterium]|jgi:DNA gyrase subunit A